jgi:hypothetical protein
MHTHTHTHTHTQMDKEKKEEALKNAENTKKDERRHSVLATYINLREGDKPAIPTGYDSGVTAFEAIDEQDGKSGPGDIRPVEGKDAEESPPANPPTPPPTAQEEGLVLPDPGSSIQTRALSLEPTLPGAIDDDTKKPAANPDVLGTDADVAIDIHRRTDEAAPKVSQPSLWRIANNLAHTAIDPVAVKREQDEQGVCVL